MFRKRTGSVVCPSCGSLVGINDDKCYTCGRANPGMWGFAPALRALGSDFGFVPLALAINIGMFLLTVLATVRITGNLGGAVMGLPGVLLDYFGSSGAGPVFGRGEWSTLLTASWLHGGLIHLVFNMMALRNLAPVTTELIGPGRTVTIYVLSGVAGFLLTSVVNEFFPVIPFLSGAGSTVGASAAICGLIGAITHYGRTTGSSLIRAHTSQWGISLVVMGLIFPGIDNVAHLGGFLGGYALSVAFNPLTRERGDHMLMALACLAATFVALAVWVWFGVSNILLATR